SSWRRLALSAVAALIGLTAQPTVTSAHDIPASVAILGYVKPTGHTLHFVLRVPLQAMRDIEWPLRGPGYLEIPKLDTLLRDATELWIAKFIEVYEGGRKLAPPKIAGALVSLPSDRSFESFDGALRHVHGAPLDSSVDL